MKLSFRNTVKSFSNGLFIEAGDALMKVPDECDSPELSYLINQLEHTVYAAVYSNSFKRRNQKLLDIVESKKSTFSFNLGELYVDRYVEKLFLFYGNESKVLELKMKGSFKSHSILEILNRINTKPGSKRIVPNNLKFDIYNASRKTPKNLFKVTPNVVNNLQSLFDSENLRLRLSDSKEVIVYNSEKENDQPFFHLKEGGKIEVISAFRLLKELEM